MFMLQQDVMKFLTLDFYKTVFICHDTVTNFLKEKYYKRTLLTMTGNQFQLLTGGPQLSN